MKPLDERRHITAAEAKACLGISPSTIRSWVHRKQLHPVGVESKARRRYVLKDILELAARR